MTATATIQPLKKSKKAIQRVTTDPRTVRQELGLNQKDFWTRYGVTQSGGSRYETGRAMDLPLRMIMALHAAGRIDEGDLKDLHAVLDDAG